MLTERIGLWDFLSEEVPTYEGITLEFLSTVEFSRASNVISFRLGGQDYERTSTQLMEILNLSTENSIFMNDTCTFQHDMSEKDFKELVCEQGILNPQRVRSMKHPTLRYIQRVLALTLFGRGETQSCFRKSENLYLYCMLRRNNGEMHYQPHFGYYLAKHLHTVATEHRPNGVISCGGVITKIARGLHINVPDRVVGGPTTLDIDGLVHMQLISRSPDNDFWMSDGPGNLGYRLPLQTNIDPHQRSTWSLDDEPVVAQPDVNTAAAQAAPAAGAGPSNQDLMNYMVELNDSWNERFVTLSTHVNAQFNALNFRLADLETPVYNTEDDAHMARWYSQQSFEHAGFEPSEDPPTPRRARRRCQAQQ